MSKKIVHQTIACLLAFLIVNVPVWALNKTDAVVNAGTAGVTNPAANTVEVSLITNRAVLDWQHLNATNAETLNFKGPGGFAVLNRVHSFVDFNGKLNGFNNGSVYIVSPYGINIGPDASISASRFVASGLNISNTDFMAGVDKFVPYQGEAAMQIGSVTNQGSINAHNAALLGNNVLNKGTIVSDGGLVVMATGDQIILGNEGSDISIVVDKPLAGSGMYNVINDVDAKIESVGGTIVLAAGDTFAQALAQDTYKNNSYSANQKGILNAAQIDMGAANEVAIRASGTTLSDDSINIGAQKVRLEKTLAGGGTVTIKADYGINALESITSQESLDIQAKTIQVRGDVVSGTTASIKAETLYSKGSIISEDELLLEAETLLWGSSDQYIRSNTSNVTSKDNISKVSNGSLYISAEQNVQLDGDVTADLGGVSVIAENGTIHTGDGTDTLNVSISGYSDDINADSGVDLPNGSGKAAIVLLSNDTLKLGPSASLYADGFYLSADEDAAFGVDDRIGMSWLQADGEFIGGWERDEGIASDVAIYAGSKSGNVLVNTTDIQTAQPIDVIIEEEIETPQIPSGVATVVFDAYHTVTMPSIDAVMDSRNAEGNENNFRGFRLEVDSRVTEWLYQAVANGTLPYAYDPEAVKAMLEQDYVLRGAGLNNSDITDGRAWVLENPPMLPAPALADLILPELKGCPVVLDSAASELAINTDDLQIIIGTGLATNPNLQPCEACQRLLVAADVLKDRDGAKMAAISEVFNTLAPIDAPFTPEITASVSTALADMAQSDPQYALAGDFVDAFVQYVAVLNSDLKVPVGDPMVYALNKYGESLLNNSNPNIVSYLMAQIETSSQTQSQQQPENI